MTLLLSFPYIEQREGRDDDDDDDDDDGHQERVEGDHDGHDDVVMVY